MKTVSAVLLTATLWTIATPSVAQDATPSGSMEDVATIDDIIRVYYEVVSGPAGVAPDRQRDEWIHHPDALVGLPSADSLGNPILITTDLAGYYEGAGGIRTQPFYEWEAHRVTERFGNIAHVWSTFVASDSPRGEVRRRGINSIQLYHDGARWWVMSWIYDNERRGNPLPAKYGGED